MTIKNRLTNLLGTNQADPKKILQRFERDVREGDIVKISLEGIEGSIARENVERAKQTITGHARLYHQETSGQGEKVLPGFALAMFDPCGFPSARVNGEGVYECTGSNGVNGRMTGYKVLERDKYSRHSLKRAKEIFELTGRKTY